MPGEPDFFEHCAAVLGGPIDLSVARCQYRRRMLAPVLARHANHDGIDTTTTTTTTTTRVLNRKRAAAPASPHSPTYARKHKLAQRRCFAQLAVGTKTTTPAPQPGTPPSYPAYEAVPRINVQLRTRDLRHTHGRERLGQRDDLVRLSAHSSEGDGSRRPAETQGTRFSADCKR